MKRIWVTALVIRWRCFIVPHPCMERETRSFGLPLLNALLIRSLLEDLLQAYQETVGLAGIQTEHVVCQVGCLFVCQHVDALIAHDEEMMGSQVNLLQNGDLCIS